MYAIPSLARALVGHSSSVQYRSDFVVRFYRLTNVFFMSLYAERWCHLTSFITRKHGILLSVPPRVDLQVCTLHILLVMRLGRRGVLFKLESRGPMCMERTGKQRMLTFQFRNDRNKVDGTS